MNVAETAIAVAIVGGAIALVVEHAQHEQTAWQARQMRGDVEALAEAYAARQREAPTDDPRGWFASGAMADAHFAKLRPRLARRFGATGMSAAAVGSNPYGGAAYAYRSRTYNTSAPDDDAEPVPAIATTVVGRTAALRIAEAMRGRAVAFDPPVAPVHGDGTVYDVWFPLPETNKRLMTAAMKALGADYRYRYDQAGGADAVLDAPIRAPLKFADALAADPAVFTSPADPAAAVGPGDPCDARNNAVVVSPGGDMLSCQREKLADPASARRWFRLRPDPTAAPVKALLKCQDGFDLVKLKDTKTLAGYEAAEAAATWRTAGEHLGHLRDLETYWDAAGDSVELDAASNEIVRHRCVCERPYADVLAWHLDPANARDFPRDYPAATGDPDVDLSYDDPDTGLRSLEDSCYATDGHEDAGMLACPNGEAVLAIKPLDVDNPLPEYLGFGSGTDFRKYTDAGRTVDDATDPLNPREGVPACLKTAACPKEAIHDPADASDASCYRYDLDAIDTTPLAGNVNLVHPVVYSYDYSTDPPTATGHANTTVLSRCQYPSGDTAFVVGSVCVAYVPQFEEYAGSGTYSLCIRKVPRDGIAAIASVETVAENDAFWPNFSRTVPAETTDHRNSCAVGAILDPATGDPVLGSRGVPLFDVEDAVHPRTIETCLAVSPDPAAPPEPFSYGPDDRPFRAVGVVRGSTDHDGGIVYGSPACIDEKTADDRDAYFLMAAAPAAYRSVNDWIVSSTAAAGDQAALDAALAGLTADERRVPRMAGRVAGQIARRGAAAADPVLDTVHMTRTGALSASMRATGGADFVGKESCRWVADAGGTDYCGGANIPVPAWVEPYCQTAAVPAPDNATECRALPDGVWIPGRFDDMVDPVMVDWHRTYRIRGQASAATGAKLVDGESIARADAKMFSEFDEIAITTSHAGYAGATPPATPSTGQSLVNVCPAAADFVKETGECLFVGGCTVEVVDADHVRWSNGPQSVTLRAGENPPVSMGCANSFVSCVCAGTIDADTGVCVDPATGESLVDAGCFVGPANPNPLLNADRIYRDGERPLIENLVDGHAFATPTPKKDPP